MTNDLKNEVAEAIQEASIKLIPGVPKEFHHIGIPTGLSLKYAQAAIDVVQKHTNQPVCTHCDCETMQKREAELVEALEHTVTELHRFYDSYGFKHPQQAHDYRQCQSILANHQKKGE